MITIYESERLRHLIRDKNNRQPLAGQSFTFNTANQTIQAQDNQNQYQGRRDVIDVLPRLVEKYHRNNQFETHLQAYLIQNIENLGIFNDENIEWLGNEVSCGVGMQRIDIMLSVQRDERVVIPIELKSTCAYIGITVQMQRYVDWIEQYYLPNRPSDIEPVLVSREIQNKESDAYNALIAEFQQFTQRNRILPMRDIEFVVDAEAESVAFTEIDYQ